MIGVIGCGNMAQAIVKGYFGKNKRVEFLTYTPSYTRAKELADAVNSKATKNLEDFKSVDTIVIACKPQQLSDLAVELEKLNIDLSKKHLISILAATPIKTIEKKLKAKTISRVMPNTPALIGAGMSLVLHSDEVNHSQKELVADFFSSCGEIALMDSEESFDKVTTVSGSGPAYVFLFADTMAKKLEAWGIEKSKAKKIAIQLFIGSSQLMQNQNELELDELISNVTSKGGVTIEAVKSYQKSNLESITSKALDAAYERSLEITKELNS